MSKITLEKILEKSDKILSNVPSFYLESKLIWSLTFWYDWMIMLGMAINMNCAAFQAWPHGPQLKITSFSIFFP
jgi:hypothetical protein